MKEQDATCVCHLRVTVKNSPNDECFNSPDWQRGEHEAFAQYEARTGQSLEYLVYVWTGGQVAGRLS